MLDSGALNRYMAKLDLTEARAKQQVTETYRKVVAAIFIDIVQHTPQYTGDLASKWQIVFGPYGAEDSAGLSEATRRNFLKGAHAGTFSPYQRGDNPAVGGVLSRELPKLDALRYNSKVRIVNTANYAEEVDKGDGPNGAPIREENLYYGKVFMVSYAAIKYGKMQNLVKVATT